MDVNKIKQMSQMLKVSEEDVTNSYDDSLVQAKSQYKNMKVTEEFIENKAMIILYNKFRPTMSSGNTNNYVGIVLGSSETYDRYRWDRTGQLKIFNDAMKQVEEDGNLSALENLFGMVVDIDKDKYSKYQEFCTELDTRDKTDEDINKKYNMCLDCLLKNDKNEVVIMHKYYDNNNNKSYNAEKPIPSVKDSQVRDVVGMAYAEGMNPEEDLRPFTLKLSGTVLTTIPAVGKIQSFKCGGKVYKEEYQLNSSVTGFVEVEDKYLQEGLDNAGLDKMCKTVMGEHYISYAQIGEWIKQYEDAPSYDIIPKKLKNSYIIVSSVMCMTQNFDPKVNKNGEEKISMSFCNSEFDMDNMFDIFSMTSPEIGKTIDFAANSDCMIIGRLNIYGKEETIKFLNLYGAIGDKNTMIPRIEAEPLGEETKEVEEPKEELKEVKKAW